MSEKRDAAADRAVLEAHVERERPWAGGNCSSGSAVTLHYIDRTEAAEAENERLRTEMQEQRKQVDAALTLIGPIQLPCGSDEAAAKSKGFKILCEAFGFAHETHLHEPTDRSLREALEPV